VTWSKNKKGQWVWTEDGKGNRNVPGDNKTPKTKLTPEQIRATNPQVAETIDLITALKDIDPKLTEAYRLWLDGNLDGMNAAVLASNFYRNNNATARSRKQTQVSQPGVYEDGLAKYKLETRKALVTLGAKIDPQAFDRIAQQAYDSGMSFDQLKQLVSTSNIAMSFGGQVLGDTTTLKGYANSFGVGNYLNDKYWSQKSRDLFLGNTTTDDIEGEIRALAVSAFPGYADQINAGITIDSIASSYKGAMANILEKDADSITYDDPKLRAALQYTDASGKPAVKPLWQFEKELRMTPEWEFTNNARNTIDNLSYRVLSDMGLI